MAQEGTAAAEGGASAVKARTVLAASRAVVELFIEQGTTAFTIKELARHAGVSERSFYRYFPRKEDVIRPFFTAGAERIAAEVIGRPADEPLGTSLSRAWAESWAVTHVDRLRALHRIFRDEESFRAQWLQVMTDSERLWAEAIAVRLGIDPRSRRAVLAGAMVATAARLSTQPLEGDTGEEGPEKVFADALEMLAPALSAVTEK
ncbi:TetR family transcriptional regulator [Actinocorallia herbida]|uniref:TetR family transcriptional regulator n=1 Tax=Actinocorallia herbida TaxID=58109 RepID=A0A3N1D330_9ACTN|nr:TetR/AcrR family transcriptional regulator [Actinocorallia herbida]ROO87943.1 TetR family transcriptional regulator [Actinocorallia herbida]